MPIRRATIPRQLNEVCEALSARLITWQATPTPLISKGLASRMNGLRVLRMDLRPEFRELLDPTQALFDQENQVMIQVELLSGNAILWDGTAFADPNILGPHGISHYLCDPSRMDEISAALAEHPLIGEETRQRVVREHRLI